MTFLKQNHLKKKESERFLQNPNREKNSRFSLDKCRRIIYNNQENETKKTPRERLRRTERTMFQKDFAWGVATAAYQIEGAANEDGRGVSIWDVYSHRDGMTKDGDTGDVACDHYHRYKEDVALMKKLGIKAYRFSISWTRILPDGTGKINEKGIDFYNRLIDELLAADITPYITLFHWDYPQALYYKGGWLNAESPDWFAEYASVVVDRFSDRVKHFITFNEPQCFIGGGYSFGWHAPGIRYPVSDVIRMAHYVMLAHGKAVIAMRKAAKQELLIGYAPTHGFPYPKDENNPKDVEAAYEEAFRIENNQKEFGWSCSWFSDPVVLGTYPEDGLRYYGKYLPETWENDLKTIAQKIDFLGQNIYNGYTVEADENGKAKYAPRKQGHPITTNGWPITPEAIRWAAKFLQKRYGLPILITENGMCGDDGVSPDGKVHDTARIDFLRSYLKELSRANDEGANVIGYFQWSFLDNYEWTDGYRYRFGLVHVDYPTQKRTVKESGYWYKEVIETNGEKLFEYDR